MYGALVWVTFVLALISFLLILVVGIWFFVERNNFINNNVSYNIYQLTADGEQSDLGNTYLLINKSTPISITLKGSSNNKKGQQLFIVNETTANVATTLMTSGSLSLSNGPTTGFSLPNKAMMTFVFTDQNVLLFTGVTATA